MQVVDLAPIASRGDGPTRDIARFNVSFPEMKLCGFRLRQRPDGSMVVDAARVQGNRLVHFAPALNAEIRAAAEAALGRPHARARA